MTSSTERSLLIFLRTRNPWRIRQERFVASPTQQRLDEYDAETDRLRAASREQVAA